MAACDPEARTTWSQVDADTVYLDSILSVNVNAIMFWYDNVSPLQGCTKMKSYVKVYRTLTKCHYIWPWLSPLDDIWYLVTFHIVMFHCPIIMCLMLYIHWYMQCFMPNRQNFHHVCIILPPSEARLNANKTPIPVSSPFLEWTHLFYG